MAISKKIFSILCCPKCRGNLKPVGNDSNCINISNDDDYRKIDKLICYNCSLMYSIENDIPVMLIQEAQVYSVDKASNSAGISGK